MSNDYLPTDKQSIHNQMKEGKDLKESYDLLLNEIYHLPKNIFEAHGLSLSEDSQDWIQVIDLLINDFKPLKSNVLGMVENIAFLSTLLSVLNEKLNVSVLYPLIKKYKDNPNELRDITFFITLDCPYEISDRDRTDLNRLIDQCFTCLNFSLANQRELVQQDDDLLAVQNEQSQTEIGRNGLLKGGSDAEWILEYLGVLKKPYTSINYKPDNDLFDYCKNEPTKIEEIKRVLLKLSYDGEIKQLEFYKNELNIVVHFLAEQILQNENSKSESIRFLDSVTKVSTSEYLQLCEMSKMYCNDLIDLINQKLEFLNQSKGKKTGRKKSERKPEPQIFENLDLKINNIVQFREVFKNLKGVGLVKLLRVMNNNKLIYENYQLLQAKEIARQWVEFIGNSEVDKKEEEIERLRSSVSKQLKKDFSEKQLKLNSSRIGYLLENNKKM